MKLDIRKTRIYGQSCDYLKWVNENPDLPSRVGNCRISVQDVDVLFHVFMNEIDKIGSREIQLFSFQEVKTRNGEPDNSQQDSWFKIDRFLRNRTIQIPDGGPLLWHLGVAIVSMEGTYPIEGKQLRCGRYKPNGSIHYEEINTHQLTLLIRGNLDPDTLRPGKFRRHHATREIAVQTVAELGFPIIEKIIRRS